MTITRDYLRHGDLVYVTASGYWWLTSRRQVCGKTSPHLCGVLVRSVGSGWVVNSTSAFPYKRKSYHTTIIAEKVTKRVALATAVLRHGDTP